MSIVKIKPKKILRLRLSNCINKYAFKVFENPLVNIFFYFRSWNIPCELITPERAKEICPLINVDDLKGALWIPGDGVGDPYKICTSLLQIAQEKGENNRDNHTKRSSKVGNHPF